MAYTDEELSEAVEDLASITYDDTASKIKVSSKTAATLYIAHYNELGHLRAIEPNTLTAGCIDVEFAFDKNCKAFVWDENLAPLCDKFYIE